MPPVFGEEVDRGLTDLSSTICVLKCVLQQVCMKVPLSSSSSKAMSMGIGNAYRPMMLSLRSSPAQRGRFHPNQTEPRKLSHHDVTHDPLQVPGGRRLQDKLVASCDRNCQGYAGHGNILYCQNIEELPYQAHVVNAGLWYAVGFCAALPPTWTVIVLPGLFRNYEDPVRAENHRRLSL